MFLNNTLHFGMRTHLEHVELRWGDIELKQNSTGEEFLLYTERATKNRTGQSNDSRPFQPKMFADPGNKYNKTYKKTTQFYRTLTESLFFQLFVFIQLIRKMANK